MVFTMSSAEQITISKEEYDDLLEELEILSNQEFLQSYKKEVEEALDDLSNGNLKSFDGLAAELGL